MISPTPYFSLTHLNNRFLYPLFQGILFAGESVIPNVEVPMTVQLTKFYYSIIQLRGPG